MMTLNVKLPDIDWRKDPLAFLLFLLMPILCFPELFFRSYTLYAADITWIHYPLKVFAAQEWRSGRVPLWNPYIQSGFPVLAEGQDGMLYPLNGLFLLPIPPYFALSLFVTLHFSLAAAFTYILARLLGISRAGATLSGLSFGFGGFLMAQVTNLNVMTGTVWLPLIMAGLIYALHTQRPLMAILAGIPLALQILVAQPQIVFYTVLFLAGYVLFQTGRIIHNRHLISSPLNQIAKNWGLLGLMIGFGLLLAAPQWLPTWELQHLSIRSAGLTYEKMIEYSLLPVQLLTLALPGLFGNAVGSSYQGLSANFEETYIYAGILPLLLACLSWRAHSRSDLFFFWLVILVSIILAIGGYNPFYRLVQYLPGFNLFRVPARWLLLVNFSLAMLAGYGMDAFLQRPGNRRLRIGLISLWLGLTALIALIWLLRGSLAHWLDNLPTSDSIVDTLRQMLGRGLFEKGSYEHLIVSSRLAWAMIPGVALISRLGLSVGLLVAYSTRRMSGQTFVAAALALTAVDLALAGGTTVNVITDARLWQRFSSAAQFVIDAQAQRPGRLFAIIDEKVSENRVAGLDAYIPSIYRVPAASGKSPLDLPRYRTVVDLNNEFRALSLTNTRYLLTNEYIEVASHIPLKLVHQGDDNWYVYENLAVLPRAFVVHRAIVAADETEALKILEDDSFNPRQAVILETVDPLPALLPAEATDDEVTLIGETPTSIEFEANLAGNGFLVLLDNDYPGWQAYVDGQPASIIRANYFARAVYLAEGLHTVQFIYRPTSFQLGLALSAIGLLSLLALIGLARTNRV